MHTKNNNVLDLSNCSLLRSRTCWNSYGRSRKLQRINSQEELDFHDSSSGSDQSEVSGVDLDQDPIIGTNQDDTFVRLVMEVNQKKTKKKF